MQDAACGERAGLRGGNVCGEALHALAEMPHALAGRGAPDARLAGHVDRGDAGAGVDQGEGDDISLNRQSPRFPTSGSTDCIPDEDCPALQPGDQRAAARDRDLPRHRPVAAKLVQELPRWQLEDEDAGGRPHRQHRPARRQVEGLDRGPGVPQGVEEPALLQIPDDGGVARPIVIGHPCDDVPAARKDPYDLLLNSNATVVERLQDLAGHGAPHNDGPVRAHAGDTVVIGEEGRVEDVRDPRGEELQALIARSRVPNGEDVIAV
mmetsp:Transcript_125520/g.363180  ORF Transcript_125520/g.363180 Transcript_125520/m.363180 type:complete len:265 (-) Transcript_125520:443-1237(-)